MSDSLRKAKEKLRAIINKSGVPSDPFHAEKTLKWLLVLKPDADEAFQLAAFTHDIDRAINGSTDVKLKDMSNYDAERQAHSDRSATIIADVLTEYKLDKNFINRVVYLVRNHECGGDDETDILKDADSIAYFDYNIPTYYKKAGEEKTRYKINYTYKRCSDKARQLIQALRYEDPAIHELVHDVLSHFSDN